MTTKSASDQSSSRAEQHDHACCQLMALGAAQRLCDQRGVRLTPTRRRVLELIWETHRAVKAYDLLERIKPTDRAAKPATIYRALEFLLEQGLIHRVESLNSFIGCNCAERQHEQLMLICMHCHEVEERPGLEVMAAVARELDEAGFQLHRKAIEIHGICIRCSDTSETLAVMDH